MKLPAKLASFLKLTPLEANVLLFLAASLAAGSIVKYFGITAASVEGREQVILDSLAVLEAEEDSVLAEIMAPATPPASASTSYQGKKLPAPASININTADKAALMQLPQVGDATAAEIIRHRLRYGKFRSINGLLDVKGIGEKKFQKLKPYITV